MKKINEFKIVFLLLTSFVFGTTSIIPALAATTPPLGMVVGYGILSSTYTNTSAGTTVNGSIGFTTGPAIAPLGVHTNYGSGAPYGAAGIDQGTLASSLNSQPCTFTFPAGPIDLSTDITHGPIGVYAPGVYCSAGAMDIGGPLSLTGTSTYIFRPLGALTSTAGSIVTLNGVSACDVFWTPTQATTLAANTTFFGTVIDDADITVGAGTVWTGTALSFGGTITTDTNTITVPVCVAPLATFSVIKTVINTGGGTASSSSFSLFVRLGASNVAGSPAFGTSSPGTTYSLTAGAYTVSEAATSSYSQSFSGDCDASGTITLLSGDNKTCTLTNTFIVPVPPVVVPPVIVPPVNFSGGGQITIVPTSTPVTPIVINIVTVPTTTSMFLPTVLGVSTTTILYPLLPDTGVNSNGFIFSWNMFLVLLGFISSLFLIINSNKRKHILKYVK